MLKLDTPDKKRIDSKIRSIRKAEREFLALSHELTKKGYQQGDKKLRYEMHEPAAYLKRIARPLNEILEEMENMGF